jgi:hypothetical protein
LTSELTDKRIAIQEIYHQNNQKRKRMHPKRVKTNNDGRQTYHVPDVEEIDEFEHQSMQPTPTGKRECSDSFTAAFSNFEQRIKANQAKPTTY